VSENLLRLLPVDPSFEPTPLQRGRGLNAFRRLVPRASKVIEECAGSTVFVDAGSNFESVHCPVCGADISLQWWKHQMDTAWNTRFEQLTVDLPCCNSSLSLNDLTYTWPQGFARWYLSAANPGRQRLTSDEIASVEVPVGTQLREVWTHY
jgi:hypothetical protein